MRVQLIRNGGCHIWQTAEKVLEETLREAGLSTEHEVVVVSNDEEAKKYRFFGSPQINIDGRDIDPTAEKAKDFQALGCRFYMRQGKMYEHPPKEMILQALKR